jgi:chromosome partitioning protein
MGLFNRGTRKHDDLPFADEPWDSNGNGATPEPPADAPKADPVAEDAAMPESVPSADAAPATEPDTDPEPEAAVEPDAAAETDSTDAQPEPAPEASFEPEPEAADATIEVRRAESTADDDEDEADDGRMTADQVLAPSRDRSVATDQPASGGKRAKVYAFANQKGGVAKTTTTLNLAVAFKEAGHRVLCVDLDPQGNLTMSQGIDPDKAEKSLYDVLVHRMPISEIIQKREIDIAVSSIDLAGAEIAMSTMIGRERALEKALNEVAEDYDFICIDTPPSLGLLTVNALTAADKVIVPVQCEYLSMRGLVQLQNTLEMIRENLNPRIEIEGILPTMLDARTVHAKEAVEILEENFGELVFKSRIRKAIKFAEAPVRGSSVLKYDPKGNAAEYYRDLAKEVLTHGAS